MRCFAVCDRSAYSDSDQSKCSTIADSYRADTYADGIGDLDIYAAAIAYTHFNSIWCDRARCLN